VLWERELCLVASSNVSITILGGAHKHIRLLCHYLSHTCPSCGVSCRCGKDVNQPVKYVIYWTDIEPQTFWGHDLDPFGSHDVIGHVTIGTTVDRFLLVIRWHHVLISHRCRDIKHHNLYNHIPIVNTFETNFGDFWRIGDYAIFQ